MHGEIKKSRKKENFPAKLEIKRILRYSLSIAKRKEKKEKIN